MNPHNLRGSKEHEQSITVVVADDHPLYRDGLTRALAARPEVTVVGETGDGDEALSLIKALQPDIALVDLRLPSRDGIAITEAVASLRIKTRILIVSAFEDISTMYQAFDAGARAYLTKAASPQVLCEAIVTVASGGLVFPESVRAGLSKADQLQRVRTGSSGNLTAREREVLVLIAAGRSAPEIAEQLYLSVATVKTHLHHIYDKLGAADRAAAVAAAARRGLLE